MFLNFAMIHSGTAYHHGDSSENSDDALDGALDVLDAEIKNYSKLTGQPIGDWDSDSGDDNESDTDDHPESGDDNESEEEELPMETQTESFNVSIRCRPLFSKEKVHSFHPMPIISPWRKHRVL